VTQTAYPQPGGCQPCPPHPFQAETTTGCGIKVPGEASSFPAAYCCPRSWSGVGSGETWGLQPREIPLPGWPSGLKLGGPSCRVPQCQAHFSLLQFLLRKKHAAAAVPAVKYLQSIPSASVGSSEQQGGSSERMFVLKSEGEAIFDCKHIWGWADW